MKIRKMGPLPTAKNELGTKKIATQSGTANIDHGSTKMAIANQHGIYSMTAQPLGPLFLLPIARSSSLPWWYATNRKKTAPSRGASCSTRWSRRRRGRSRRTTGDSDEKPVRLWGFSQNENWWFFMGRSFLWDFMGFLKGLFLRVVFYVFFWNFMGFIGIWMYLDGPWS